jgi:hypothetical protein
MAHRAPRLARGSAKCQLRGYMGPDVLGPRFMVYIVLPFGWTLSPYFWGAVM